MRYYSFNEQDDKGNDVVQTMSEDEIREEYYPYWKERMIKKYGEEEFKKTWSFEECLEDWITIHWAWEVKN